MTTEQSAHDLLKKPIEEKIIQFTIYVTKKSVNLPNNLVNNNNNKVSSSTSLPKNNAETEKIAIYSRAGTEWSPRI
jgi:hypothetical protein